MRGAFAEKRRQVSHARRRQAGSSTVRGALSRSRAIIPPTPCGTGLKRPFALGGKAGASLCEPCGTGRRREQRSALQVRSAGGRRSKSERRETAVTTAGSRLPGHGLRGRCGMSRCWRVAAGTLWTARNAWGRAFRRREQRGRAGTGRTGARSRVAGSGGIRAAGTPRGAVSPALPEGRRASRASRWREQRSGGSRVGRAP